MRRLALAVTGSLLLPCALAARAEPGRTEIVWLGQAGFKITTPGGKVIVIDPWLTGNPRAPAAYKQPEALGKVDVLLVTHGHDDHIKDAPAIARLRNVPMYAPGDLNRVVAALGILPPALAPRFNKGGTLTPAPGIRVTAVRAEHSSLLAWRNPATDKEELHTGGEPVGFIIELENGYRIYHAGDTAVFGDMRLIGERYKPDLALVPIGGHFTMDPADAAYAVRELLKPKVVMPMHYGTNPLAKGTAKEFADAMAGSGIKIIAPQPGEAVTL